MATSRSLPRKKILVVEDDPDILNVIKLMLGSEGYEVETHLDGKQIVDNLTVLPDLYILDKILPDVDGLHICRFLKSHPTTKDIPVIVISAKPAERAALEVGADKFIEKPFLMRPFLNSIAEALKVKPKKNLLGP